MRRRANARVLTGPIALSRLRLRDAALLEPAAARDAVNVAALDCLAPGYGSVDLSLFTSLTARDVCTFGIVTRSATTGPAARWPADSPVAQEARAALGSVLDGFAALDERLGAGSAAGPEFTALGGALDRLEAAILGALRVTAADIA